MIEARQSDSRLKTLVASAVIGVTCNRAVPTSVMPKGVEHVGAPSSATSPSCADLCDAERR
jgi:hypothetical protein